MLTSKLDIIQHIDSFFEVFDNISDLVYIMRVDEAGRFRYLFVNEPAKRMAKLEDGAIGKTIEEVMPKESAEIINAQYHNAIKLKEYVTYEDFKVSTSLYRQNEQKTPLDFIHFESKITPVFDQNGVCTYVIAIVRDISDRKRKEIELTELKNRYQMIADNMTDLVSNIDSNGIMIYASPSHESVLGYTPKVYEGKRLFDFIHPQDRDYIYHQFMDIMVTKQTKTVEFRHMHANGNCVWLEAKASPVLDGEKNILHVLVVAREIMERKSFEKKLRYMAYHDMLTDLPNRRLFTEKLEQALKEIHQSERKIAVMYLDLDKFKLINDTLGHDVGDELLIQFSQRVKGCIKKCDILARIGGDEFCALLEIEHEMDANVIAEKIIDSLKDKWKIGEHEFVTTSSIGIAIYEKGFDVESLIKAADQALYRAKEKGRNNYQIYINNEKH
ncbi:diguanylate cyclase [Bacillus sp. BRMEA1]|uniref:diguanylate cyclase domain-containing protein n=1 Tax=Neobacillus endophyticus TaxID=2738405 RepID=UPI0015656B5A|nr:sensor domain-containing diguanylate cyclase [Neobacillus endophyticus]NRD76831.1 diguanylate cyclase [Neobacillus endophyticus]